MSKFNGFKERFVAFVNQLTAGEAREQLVLAYLQMEKCRQVLKGYDVEPEKMMDNGESSDLELFYRCKESAEKLASLNKMVHDGKKVGTLELEIKVDVSAVPKGIGIYADKFPSAKWPFVESVIAQYEKEWRNRALKDRFSKGQEVWYMFGDRVQHSTIEHPMRDVDGVTIYRTKLGHDTAECETFGSLEDLLENLKKTVNG